MATEDTIKMSERYGILPISPKIAVDAIFNVVSDGKHSVVALCPVNREKLDVNIYYDKEKLSFEVSSSLDRPAIKSIIKSIATNLGLDDIEDDTPWRDAGLDSLSMVLFFIESI